MSIENLDELIGPLPSCLQVRSPSIGHFARRSISLERSYTSSLEYNPSRATLLSDRPAYRTGMYCNCRNWRQVLIDVAHPFGNERDHEQAGLQGQLRNFIGTLPRYRHGIVPIPDEIAPINTGGRGGLQNCMFNTYNLAARPLFTLPALAVHECTPGHSFQAALALEAPERPAFRKNAQFSGYVEGWGLYTEWLGTKMGIYRTPYEDFGRLTYEMWRAARLVIDTGIHSFGWSREQAIQYLRDNTALAEHEIVTEVDRYIGNPGQAAAYKLGELQIRRHRAEAEAALGEKFDQKAFHDAILAIGPVPLPVLAERMDRFIEEEQRKSQ